MVLIDMKQKKKIGRPVSVDGKRVNIYLDKYSMHLAKVVGDGNASRGIRIAVKEAAKNRGVEKHD